MKTLKHILSLTTLIILLSGLAACNKASHNGALDGQWQITTIENLSSGETTVPNPARYICINLHIMQLTGGNRPTANMTYDKKAGHISCDFPYVEKDKTESTLSPWGIYSNPVEFDVVKLNHKELVLRTDRTLITCRRF